MNLKGAKENPWRKSRAEQSRSHSALCTTCQMQNKSQKTEPETETCCHYIPYFTTCHLCGVLRERGKDVCVENGLRISAYKILFHWQSQLQDKQTSHSAKKTISLALLLYPFSNLLGALQLHFIIVYSVSSPSSASPSTSSSCRQVTFSNLYFWPLLLAFAL